MIKLRGSNGTREVVILGLSEGNLKRLREKKPIVIHGEEIQAPIDIVICWGETEDSLAKELGGLIDEHTRVTDHRGDKKN